MAAKARDHEIEELENDLASLSEIDEAARILILRARQRENLEELVRIRQVLYRMWLRATERRKRTGRKLPRKTAAHTRTRSSPRPRLAAYTKASS